MRRTSLVRTLPILVLATSASVAWAQLPADQNYTFYLRETPTDPQSPVTLEITLDLHAEQADGNYVAWTVSNAEFHRPPSEGVEEATWQETAPVIPTTDGYWWVEHADPGTPTLAEFADTPLALTGLAPSIDPMEDSLDYAFESNPYTPPPPPDEEPYAQTSILSGSFLLAVLQEIVEDPDDEPVEVGGTRGSG